MASHCVVRRMMRHVWPSLPRRLSSHLQDEESRSLYYLKSTVPHSMALELQRSRIRCVARRYTQPEATVMYLTLTGLPMTFDFVDADAFLNIMTYVYRLVEERISLYRVYVLYRSANHYLIASGENPTFILLESKTIVGR